MVRIRSNRTSYSATLATCLLLVSPFAYSQFNEGDPPDVELCGTSTASRLATAAACGAGSVAVCAVDGFGNSEFSGCYRPQPSVLVPPDFPEVGEGGVSPTGPEPANPGEELDRGQADEEEMHGKECGGNPIDIGSGNKYQLEIDYSGPGALPLRITRHYNSKGADWSTHKGLFGQGWTSNFEEKIVAFSETDPSVSPRIEKVIIQNETGHRFQLTSTDDGPWLATNGRTVVFQQDPTNDYWTFLDGTTAKVFQPSGHIDSITHENGEFLTFQYSEYEVTPQISDLQLDSVTHSSGAQISFTYDTLRRILTVTDSELHQYSYTYTGHNLTKATLPAANNGVDEIAYKYADLNYTSHLTGKQYLPWPSDFATWKYNADGLAISSEHSINVDKFQLAFDFDSPLAVKRTTTNAYGKETEYTFTKVGGDYRSTSVDGIAHGTCQATNRSSTYDANGYYDLVVDREGNTIDFDYDTLGQLQQVTTGVGSTESRTVSYDEWNDIHSKPEKITTALLETILEYDFRGRAKKVTQKNKSQYGVWDQTREWNITYLEYAGSPTLQKMTIDGPRPGTTDTTEYNYNTNGLLTSIDVYVSAELSLTTTFENYDLMGRVGKITYPAGMIREFQYDPRGRITSVTETIDGVPTTTSYEYHTSGDIEKITYSDGSAKYFGYDSIRRLTSIGHHDDDADYDNGRWKKTKYDIASNVIGDEVWVKQLGWVFDPNCNPFLPPFPECSGSFQMTDVQKFNRVYEYDSLGRMTQAKLKANFKNRIFEYDKNDLLVVAKDGFSRSTTYSRNANYEIESTTYRDTGVSEITYDANGQVSGVRDPENNWTYYRRDGFGQPWEIDSPATGLTSYEYDVAGNMVKKTDARLVELNYEYDNLNRLEKVFVGSAQDPVQEFEYDTDEPGYLYKVTDESGEQVFDRDSAGRIISKDTTVGLTVLSVDYRYDAHGRLDRITYPSGLQVDYAFNTFGEIDSVSATGAGLATSTVVSNVGYMPWGPLQKYTFGNGELRSQLVYDDYSLYRVNSGTHIARTLSQDSNDNILGFDNRSFTYDDMDRVKTHAGPDGSFEYNYDLNGNRNWHKEGTAQTDYNYDASRSRLNTLSNATTQSRYYDANGNTIQIDGRYFDYDDLNRNWRYREPGVSVDYTYNAFGARVTKDDGNDESIFIYDGASLLHERNSSLARDYIYLDGDVVGFVQSGTLYFVHNDHIGRPEVVTNSAKAVVWNSQNNAFDNAPGTDFIGNLNIGFPGQYYDIESGTYYNYYRTYDSTTGRYLQSDPIGLSGGLNTYTYAAANPIKNVDPYGLDLSDNRNRNIGLGGGCVAGAIIFGKAGAAGCAVTGPGYLGCEATAMLCGCLGGAIGGSLFGLGADAVETVVNNVGADGDETEDAGTDDLTGSDDGDLGPTSSDDVAQGIGKIASGTGLSERDVRDRIHGAKGNLPKSAGIRNPDVGVDLDTGEIYPVNPDGSLGDSIGNIYDEPGGYR